MSLTTKQKLDADPNLAWFIDSLGPVLKWGKTTGAGTMEAYIEVCPPGMPGVWDD